MRGRPRAGAPECWRDACQRRPPSPSPTPIFESRDAAEAAAQRLWEAYLRATSIAAQTGGADLTALRDLLGDEQFARESEILTQIGAEGARLEGEFAGSALEVTAYVEDELGVLLKADGCLDATAVSRVGADGTRTVLKQPLTSVSLEFSATSESGLVIDLLTERQGGTACDP